MDTFRLLEWGVFNCYIHGENKIQNNKYNVFLSYDLNGNIQTLQRLNNLDLIDDLSYKYNGNQLLSVSDGGNSSLGFKDGSNSSLEYAYDSNGNMISDKNKYISKIEYNSLNLPKEILVQNQRIRYMYSSSGEKLQNILASKTLTYSNGFVYENGSLSYILTSVGRYVMNGSSGKYEYNICDHLGNVRAVVDDSGELLQQNDYYPFGGVMSSFGGSDNKYLYNGKELQEGTDWLDYGARMYDGYLGRFFCVDAHAENYLSCTPYNYVGNNPLLFIDPNGMDWYKHSETGSISWREGNKKIEGYTNIGATYTENLGGGISMTYTQQDLTSITFTTLSNSDWETQAYIDANGKERWDGCKKTCDKMLAKVKGKSTRSGEMIVTTGDKNGVVNGTTGKLSDGTKSINSSIDNGMPVIVGVDYKKKQKHNFKKYGGDGMTDHFILIMGKTETYKKGVLQGVKYRFFDPRTKLRNQGTSKQNTLSVTKGYLKGSYLNERKKYKVTAVRKTKKTN